jgi:hypothetical protein
MSALMESGQRIDPSAPANDETLDRSIAPLTNAALPVPHEAGRVNSALNPVPEISGRPV